MTYTNWDYVREIDIALGHKGVAARRAIERDLIVGIYDGPIKSFRLREGRLVEPERHCFIVQIAVQDELLFGLYREDPTGIGYINHSCKPNVCVRDRIVLQASRDIEAGEALTLDYRRWDFIPEGITCWCDEPRCVI